MKYIIGAVFTVVGVILLADATSLTVALAVLCIAVGVVTVARPYTEN